MSEDPQSILVISKRDFGKSAATVAAIKAARQKGIAVVVVGTDSSGRVTMDHPTYNNDDFVNFNVNESRQLNELLKQRQQGDQLMSAKISPRIDRIIKNNIMKAKKKYGFSNENEMNRNQRQAGVLKRKQERERKSKRTIQKQSRKKNRNK